MNYIISLCLLGTGIFATLINADQVSILVIGLNLVSRYSCVDKDQFVHQLETIVKAAGAAYESQHTNNDPVSRFIRKRCFVRHICKPKGCRRVLRKCKRCANVYGYQGCLRICPKMRNRCFARCPRLGKQYRLGCHRAKNVCQRRCNKKRNCLKSCYKRLKDCLKRSVKWVKLCKAECQAKYKSCPWLCYTKRVKCNLGCNKQHCDKRKCFSHRIPFQRYLCLRPCDICHKNCYGGMYKRCSYRPRCSYLLCRKRACITKRICKRKAN